jgi:hypothetical protein
MMTSKHWASFLQASLDVDAVGQRQASLSLPMVEAESPPASFPSDAASASSKSPVETPLR